MKLSERIKELQWIFTRIILWYKKQDKRTRKEFLYFLNQFLVDISSNYDFDPREKGE